eukprot:COSAG02_NODE_7059_length_3204_cov_4.882126_3_plen_163_part_00
MESVATETAPELEPEPEPETQVHAEADREQGRPSQPSEHSARIFSCAAKVWGKLSVDLGLCTSTVEVLDVRKTLKHANPHHDAELKPKTGLDPAVVEFIASKAHAEFESLVLQAVEAVQLGRSVCIVCVGGKHRSVAIAEQAACRLGLRAEHLMLPTPAGAS